MAPTDDTSNALIQKDIAYIQKDISEIKTGIKDLAGVYQTKLAADDISRAFDLRLKKVEDSSNIWKWLSPTLAAVVSGVMVFLIVQYLSK